MSYKSWNKDELVEEADERGIDSSGTKAEIMERLEADDAARSDTEELETTEPEGDASGPSDAGVSDAEVADAPSAAATGESDHDAAVESEPMAHPGNVNRVLTVPADRTPDPDAGNAIPAKWEAFADQILDTLKDEASDLWKEEVDQDFLKSVARDLARQKWRVLTASDERTKRIAKQNIAHLQAQVAGEVARRKMHLVERGDDLLTKILTTTIKVVSGSLVSMVL